MIKRTSACTIMMTPDEYARLRVAAAHRGLTASSFGYELLKGATGGFFFSPNDAPKMGRNGEEMIQEQPMPTA